MKKFIAMALAALGVIAAGAASTACVLMIFDEPEMPKSML
jgi:cyclic lactone autoinducer peptide